MKLLTKRTLSASSVKDVKKIWQDIENDLIIKDQMASLGCLLVCTFGNFLAPVLVAAHTVNKLDLGHDQDHENEGYECEGHKIWPWPGLRVWIKWMTCLKMYFGISLGEPALSCCTCWNVSQGLNKCMMRQYAQNHFHWRMSLIALRHKKSATRQCERGSAQYCLSLIIFGRKKCATK